MTPQQSDLQLALDAYGEAMVVFAESDSNADYATMCYWQDKAWRCAKEVANTNKQGE